MDDIADELFKKHNFKTLKTDKPVFHTWIEKVLKNPFYYGAMRWSGEIFNGNHDPIVSKELWDKVNGVTRGISPTTHKDNVYLALRGMVRDIDN